MPRRFELLVFDWDGTLMDSAAAIVSALKSACIDLDLPVPSDEQARYIIGLGLNDAMSHIHPGIDPAHYPRIVERYRFHDRGYDSRHGNGPGCWRSTHCGGLWRASAERVALLRAGCLRGRPDGVAAVADAACVIAAHRPAGCRGGMSGALEPRYTASLLNLTEGDGHG